MVYVDHAKNPYGRMLMCHMVADTTPELLAMAAQIGLNPSWIQHQGQDKEHFDLSQTKRALAVRAGAKEVSGRELVAVIRRKREEILARG